MGQSSGELDGEQKNMTKNVLWLYVGMYMCFKGTCYGLG